MIGLGLTLYPRATGSGGPVSDPDALAYFAAMSVAPDDMALDTDLAWPPPPEEQ